MANSMKSKLLTSLAVISLAGCGTWDKPFPDDQDPYAPNTGAGSGQQKPNSKKRPTTSNTKPEVTEVPPEPPKPKPEAGAYYEIGAASAPFHLTKPAANSTRLPDKLLRRREVVKLTTPEAGGSWSKVRLADGQIGYVPLASVKIVEPSERPTAPPAPTIDRINMEQPLEDIGIDRPTTRPTPAPRPTPPPPRLPDIPDPSDAANIRLEEP